MRRIRALDLFHGAGGSSTGAKMAGVKIVAAIDNWNIASLAYSRNLPETKVINEDIKKVSPKRLREIIGDIDLILASPECTNHSCAKGAGVRCENSRMTAFQVIRFTKEFMPKWVVIENVIQMRSWDRHRELVEALRNLGYYVREEILNAQDFGVPQSRRRLFLLCSQTGEIDCVEKPKKEPQPARSVIDLNGNYSYTPLYSPKRAIATIQRAERAVASLGTKEPFLIVYYGTDGSGGWQPIDRPLRTVTTIDRFAFVKPTTTGYMMRMLQPEELKAAMGFPETYRLQVGTRREKVKLMGNAVCPPVMKSIVRTISRMNR
jgi:DNA (cytosine-5)-methyltransferase 1